MNEFFIFSKAVMLYCINKSISRVLIWEAPEAVRDGTWRFVSLPVPNTPVDFKVTVYSKATMVYDFIDAVVFPLSLSFTH